MESRKDSPFLHGRLCDETYDESAPHCVHNRLNCIRYRNFVSCIGLLVLWCPTQFLDTSRKLCLPIPVLLPSFHLHYILSKMELAQKDTSSSGKEKHEKSIFRQPVTQDFSIGSVDDVGSRHLQRKLTWRQMQLMIIGGSIGTALFITIGAGLMEAGPGNLFLGFILYAAILACCNNCIAEMSTYMPVSGGWMRMASHWVDDALGFALGWNFFIYQATLIPYEISAFNLVLSFWSDKIPSATISIGCTVAYGFLLDPICAKPAHELISITRLINIAAVHYYGEAEFWLASGST
jgi:amino acid permease